MISNELDDLALRYGSDKTPFIKHFYTEYYYELFAPIREKVKRVLEIGVGDSAEMSWTGVPNYQTGASLRMWRDFFPHAQVYGADIKPLTVDEPRISVMQCDQANADDLKRLLKRTGKSLDIVIDDGSHLPEHQLFTCRTLMPMLKRGVLYLIEDCAHPEIIDSLPEYRCHAVRHSKMRFKDDRVILVQHRG